MEIIHIANTKPNKDGVALLISDKVDLEVMNIAGGKEENFTIIIVNLSKI